MFRTNQYFSHNSMKTLIFEEILGSVLVFFFLSDLIVDIDGNQLIFFVIAILSADGLGNNYTFNNKLNL